MVKPTIEDIRHSDLTPLERELALASFGAEALTVAQMEESLAAEDAAAHAHDALHARLVDGHVVLDAALAAKPEAHAARFDFQVLFTQRGQSV